MTDSTVVSPARVVAGERYHAVRSSLAALTDLDLARLSAQAANRLGPLGTPAASGLRRALDPRPEVMHPTSWAAIEVGVAERIALLEALAQDVYGPQLTLARGLLPPEAVWSSPLLTRAAMGRPPLGGRWLVHAAIDIGMLASGDPVAVAAETASLAGLGLAYQNRLTTAELLPGPFTRARVRRLLPFLDRLRAALAGLARSGTGRGRVVILSPPRTDPAHDDVALLARTLGYTLVEGADLTVRRGAVRVRSLGGLEPVDVVLRLLPDAQCDPLELDAGSRAGTPGLVVAAWRGEVALANPIGAQWLSSPALAAFLPGLSRALLGTEPTLAGPAAWWCGDEMGRARARAALDDVILLPFDGGPSIESRLLDASGQRDLVDRLDKDGRNWVAMARPELAPSASWVDGQVRLLPSVVRTFAVVDRAGTAVAPGGLARVLVDESPRVWELASGAPTRDTWVLSTGAPGDDARVRVALPQVDLSDSLPSRAGESLYWLGRHAERAEAVVRLARTVAELAPDGGEGGDGPAWPSWLGIALDRLTGVFDSAPALTRELGSVAARALTEADRPLGLPATLAALASSAASVQELLSPELFRAVDDAAVAGTSLGATLGPDRARVGKTGGLAGPVGPAGPVGLPGPFGLADPVGPELRQALERLLGDLAAVAGLAQETMVRGPGWYLLDAGRRVERAFALVDVLGSTLVGRPAHHLPAGLLEALLGQSASLIAYRRRYRSDPELAAVTGLLVVDGTNPRSLRFQLDALVHDIGHLPEGIHASTQQALVGEAAELASRVAAADPVTVARAGPDGHADQLARLIDNTRAGLSRLATGINLQYIAHVPAAQLPTGTLPDVPQEAAS